MAAPPKDGTPYKMPEYPPGGPYPCSARPPPRFLGPPVQAPPQPEECGEVPQEAVDPNGPAVCGMAKSEVPPQTEEAPSEDKAPVTLLEEPEFLPLGAGGPPPPTEITYLECNLPDSDKQ